MLRPCFRDGAFLFLKEHIHVISYREEITMKEKLTLIREQAIAAMEAAKDLNALNEVRVAYLGKKGELTEILRGMKDLSPEERQHLFSF